MAWVLAAVVILAVAILTGVVYQLLETGRDLRRVPPPGRLVDVGSGRRLHLCCRGAAGPSVIFESGIAASSLSWSRVQPRVAEFTRACSYDRPGLGWSPALSRRDLGSFDAVSLADQLHALLHAAGIPPPFVVVGHSFGGFVAQAFASWHPGEVAGMVLLDPIYPAEWLALTADQRRRLAGGVFLSRVGGALARVGFVRAVLRLLTRGSTAAPQRVSRLFGSEAAGLLHRMVGEVRKLPEEVWPAVQAHWSQPKCFVSMGRHLATLTRSAVQIAECAAARQDMPLVVISADSQPPACLAEHARLAARSAKGRHVVATVGHWVHLDDPDLVVEAIRDVVEAVRHGAGVGAPSGAPRANGTGILRGPRE
jgi:pimeloyl-ACP methyl ester carboxylesterase